MKNKDLYHIPKKYKKAEQKYLQKDRNEMYDEMDYTLDKKIGFILEQLYEYKNDEYYIGIHRTCNDKDLIMHDGLCYGTDKEPYIHDHVQIMKNYPFFLRELKYCESYKGSLGCILVKVPKKDIDPKYKDDTSEPIYYVSKDGKSYLRPEYIVGYVDVINRQIKEVELNKFPHNDIYDENTVFLYDELMNEKYDHMRKK